jgi:hypothetical protein
VHCEQLGEVAWYDPAVALVMHICSVHEPDALERHARGMPHCSKCAHAGCHVESVRFILGKECERFQAGKLRKDRWQSHEDVLNVEMKESDRRVVGWLVKYVRW